MAEVRITIGKKMRLLFFPSERTMRLEIKEQEGNCERFLRSEIKTSPSMIILHLCPFF